MLPLSCLVSLGLIATRPAHAQYGGWVPVPCDAQGNSLPHIIQDSSGFYEMGGTTSGTVTNGYPAPMIAAGRDTSNSNNSQYLDAGYPLWLDTIPTYHFTWEGIAGYPGFYAEAGNSVQNGRFTYNVSSSYGSPNQGIINGSVQVDVSGQLVYYFQERWQGYGPPTTAMPDHLGVLLRTTVTAGASVDYGYSAQTSGLSATATASDGSPYNEKASASASVGGIGDSYENVVGYHLERASVDKGTGIAEVYLSGTVSEQASNSVPYGILDYSYDPQYPSPTETNGLTKATSNANVTSSVKPDDRKVSISCPTIEDSYYKSATPDATHGDRYLNQRNKDDSMQGDSAATYSNADSNRGWVANATFVGNPSGFTNPTYAWSSDFSGAAMVGVDLTQPSVAGSWFLYSADKLPVTKTVTLTVKDGPGTDGATAANTYAVKWHLPYEAPNPVPYSVVPGKYQVQPARLGPVAHDQTQLKKPTQAQHIDWEATINGASVVAKVAGQEEIAGGLEIIEAIAKIAKPYTDVDADSNTETGATNNFETWSDSMKLYDNDTYGGGNIPADLQGNPEGYLLCDMYIYQVVHYKDKYWYADGYNSHGYDGTSNNVVYLRNIDDVSDEFYYVRHQPSGAGASPVPPTPMQSVSDQPAAAE